MQRSRSASGVEAIRPFLEVDCRGVRHSIDRYRRVRVEKKHWPAVLKLLESIWVEAFEDDKIDSAMYCSNCSIMLSCGPSGRGVGGAALHTHGA